MGRHVRKSGSRPRPVNVHPLRGPRRPAAAALTRPPRERPAECLEPQQASFVGVLIAGLVLASEPCFATGPRLAPRYAGSPGFRRMTPLSAEVNALNNALHAGPQPQNLVTAPAFLFLSAPTEVGWPTRGG